MANTKKESLFWGLIILILGMLFLLKNFGLEIDVWHLLGKYWPLILVYIGLQNIYLYTKKKKNP
jgi:lia operon protein LiaF